MQQVEGSNIESFHQNQPAQLQPQGLEDFPQIGVDHWLSPGLEAGQTPWETGIKVEGSSSKDLLSASIYVNKTQFESNVLSVHLQQCKLHSWRLVQSEAFHVNSPTRPFSRVPTIQLLLLSCTFKPKHYHSNLISLTWDFNNCIPSSSGSTSGIRSFKKEQGAGIVQQQGGEGEVRVGQLGGESKHHGTNRWYWQLVKPMQGHIWPKRETGRHLLKSFHIDLENLSHA